MQVTLIDHTADPENLIGRMAAECYDAKTDRESNIRRAKHCTTNGHLATLRFASATFRIEGISRICSHQLVRVAHAGILQKSQRYVDSSNVEFVRPPALSDAPIGLQMAWAQLEQASKDLYSAALDAGMKKEDARFALLHSADTNINIVGNFQFWRDWLANRTAKAAQWEVREVAQQIGLHLSTIAPNIFAEYGPQGA